MNSKSKKRVAIYSRVSTNKSKDDPKRQEVENQLIQLREHCQREGWIIHKEYIEYEGGGKAERKVLNELFTDASERKFDLVLFWALDRFSREGVLPTLQRLQLLDHYGVDFFSYTEAYLNSTGIFKEAVIGILATLAKQERVKISERTKAGLERARKKGKIGGRPRIPQEKIDKVIKLGAKNLSMRKIADMVGISLGMVNKILSSRIAGRVDLDVYEAPKAKQMG